MNDEPKRFVPEVSDPERLVRDPLVSVVMITYNHERFIAQAIEGVLEQKTTFPFELIIGEDCSTDRTREIVLKYQQENPGAIRALVPETNLGAHANFLSTYAAARGKYVALCEGDDYWCDSTKLTMQLSAIENEPGCHGVFHDQYRYIEYTGEMIARIGSRDICKIHDTESIIVENLIGTATMFFRKFNLDKRSLEKLLATNKGDYMVAMLVSEKGYWRFLSKAMSVYRVHDGGIWSGEKRVSVCKQDVDFFEILFKDNFYVQHKKTISQRKKNSLRHLATAYSAEGSFTKSIYSYIKSIGSRNKLNGKYLSSKNFWLSYLRHSCIKAKRITFRMDNV